MKNNHVSILGAGLIGSLLSVFLRKQGLSVSVFEKLPAVSKSGVEGFGGTVNLSLSDRGRKAIEKVGLGESIEPLIIPMYGSRVHDEHGNTAFIPYGKEGQTIYSINRNSLNQLLIEKAIKEGVRFFYDHKCEDVDLNSHILRFSLRGNKIKMENGEVIIGADGAYSSLRSAFQTQIRLNFTQQYISHGFIELTIPPTASGDYAMDAHALHLWPRGKFMLMAMPNIDKSFTCTLFLPFEGSKVSFDKINDEKDLITIFKTYFDDAYQLMPNLVEDFFSGSISSIVNISCYPWSYKNNLLIGDASHALVPFYGQGMNCGFEDCYYLNDLIEKYGTTSWELIFGRFEKDRKAETDAISQIAMDNFNEMRNSGSDPKSIIRKRIELKLNTLFPDKWIPLYNMVTFTDMAYSDAYIQGQLQKRILDRVMEEPTVTSNWQNLDYSKIVDQLETTSAV